MAYIFLLLNIVVWTAYGREVGVLLRKNIRSLDLEEQVDTLLRMARTVKDSPQLSYSYALEAYQIATDAANQDGIIRSLQLTSYIQKTIGNYRHGERDLIELVNLLKNTARKQDLANAYLGLGEVRRQLKKENLAFNDYTNALDLFESTGNLSGKGIVYNNLGILFKEQGNYSSALKYYDLANQIANAGNDLDLQSAVYNNLGTLNVIMDNFNEAESNYKFALELKRKINDKLGESTSLNNLAALYERKGMYKLAGEYFLQAIAVSETIEDNYGIALGLGNLGEIKGKEQKYGEAISFLKKGDSIAQKYQFLDILSLNEKIYSNIYMLLNRPELAFKHLKRHTEYNEELLKQRQTKRLAELQVQFETKEKEKEIELLRKDNKLNTLYRNSLMVVVFLITVIAVLSTLYMRSQVRKKKELIKQRQLIFEQNMALSEAALERSKIKERELSNELEYKNRQLTTHTLNLIQKNKLMDDLKKHVTSIRSGDDQVSKKLNKLQTFINYSHNLDKEWDVFRMHFENVNQDFFKNLKEKHPDISSAEMKLAALVRLNLSMKEMATLLNISPGSVKTARYRLRKKFDLRPEEDLSDYLLKF